MMTRNTVESILHYVRAIGLATVLLLCLPYQIAAHENNRVHSGLTNAAIALADIPEITARGFFDIDADDQCGFIDEGAVKEDYGLSSCSSWDCDVWGESNCGLAGWNWMNHAYNPINGDGWSVGGMDTVTYAVPIWNDALWEYEYGDLPAAYFTLGRICHLLEDMTAPAHTHADIHATGDDFEDWGDANFNSYDFAALPITPFIPSQTVTLPDSSQVPGHSIEGFLHTLAQFSYNLSAFDGYLQEVAGPQPDSELARMFPSLHYYDAGILGDDYWEMDNIGKFEKIDIDGDEWWACENDHTEDNGGPGGARRIIGNFYIENAAGDNGTLTPAVFEKIGVYQANPNSKTLMEIYGDVLFPKTVSCVAGLLFVFTETIPDPPPLVSPPHLTFAQGEIVTFLWNPAPGANQYQVQIALDPDFTNLVFDAELGDTTSLELAGFPDNGTTPFYWRSKAGNPAGWSDYSNFSVFTSGCRKADFNSDCLVDLRDLAIFVSHWLDTGCSPFDRCHGTDLIQSPIVDVSDFTAFAEHWLQAASPTNRMIHPRQRE